MGLQREVVLGDVGFAHPLPKTLAHRQFPQHDSDGEEIRTPIHGKPATCSGAMYASLPFMSREGLGCVRARELGDTEVDHLHHALVGDEDVLWADVAMDDAKWATREIPKRVDVVKGRQHIADDLECQAVGSSHLRR
jgi:hypothetical protein